MMNGISIIMINSNNSSRCCRLISSNNFNKIISKSSSSNNNKRLLCHMTTSYHSNQVEQQQEQQYDDLTIKRRRQQHEQQFFHGITPIVQNFCRSNIRITYCHPNIIMQRRSYSTSTSSLSISPSNTTATSSATTSNETTTGTVTSSPDNNQLPSLLENNTKLIDFYISSKIEGEESNVVMIDIVPGEILRAEAGSMIFMTEGIVMDTKMNGVSSAFNRVLTGQNTFLTDFYYDPTTITSNINNHNNNKGTVCLGTDFPSKILRFNINELPNQTLICQRGAYLASNSTVHIETEFTKSFTSGFFGGQGFILQKLNGIGDVLIKCCGTIKTLTLQPNETLRVTSGSIVAFESTVSYDVQMMSGMTNIMFSGEGLFVTTLKGPGQVWLQGMTPDRMVSEITRRIPSSSGIGFGIPLGIGGAGGGGGTEGGSSDGTIIPTPGGIGDDNSTKNSDVLLSSDEAINADRNATVASSGVSSSNNDDANSPNALFGDAVPTTTTNSSTIDYDNDAGMNSNVNNDDDNTSFSSSSSNETLFGDDLEFHSDEFTATNDNSDDFSNDINNNEMKGDGELFYDDNSDSTSTSDTIDEVASSGENSIFSTLWDFFTGRDE